MLRTHRAERTGLHSYLQYVWTKSVCTGFHTWRRFCLQFKVGVRQVVTASQKLCSEPNSILWWDLSTLLPRWITSSHPFPLTFNLGVYIGVISQWHNSTGDSYWILWGRNNTNILCSPNRCELHPNCSSNILCCCVLFCLFVCCVRPPQDFKSTASRNSWI